MSRILHLLADASRKISAFLLACPDTITDVLGPDRANAEQQEKKR